MRVLGFISGIVGVFFAVWNMFRVSEFIDACNQIAIPFGFLFFGYFAMGFWILFLFSEIYIFLMAILNEL